MDFDSNIKAKLVYDGGDEVWVPEEMGRPRDDQMVGTPAERLSELSLRICYDSMGIQPDGTPKKSRGSVDAHKHILEVGHLSVYEHFNFSIALYPLRNWEVLRLLVNRPGLWIAVDKEQLVLSMNLRTLLDWDLWSELHRYPPAAWTLGRGLRLLAEDVAPVVFGKSEDWELEARIILDSFGFEAWDLSAPLTQQEKWISLYLSGSRGFSHEMVRHGDRTAISQRSTRYVDEAESPWVEHPLLTAYFEDEGELDGSNWDIRIAAATVILGAQALYRETVTKLESWLVKRGTDKLTARKQARGAARGYLGNALATEMIFSASVSQWRHMLEMRASNAADAEIRAVMTAAIPELKRSRYGGDFQGIEVETAKDGLGFAMAGGGHR